MIEFIVSQFLGLIKAILAIFGYIQNKKRSSSYEAFFVALKDSDNWKTDGHVMWIYKPNPNFVIEIGDDEELSSAMYCDHKFPNPYTAKVDVRLKSCGQVLETRRFMRLDDYRYFVPLTKSEYMKEEAELEHHYVYWDLDHYDFDLFKIIGHLYRNEETIESFTKKTGIKIKP